MTDTSNKADPFQALIARVKAVPPDAPVMLTRWEMKQICARAEEFWAAVDGRRRISPPPGIDTNTGPQEHYM